MIPHTNIDNCFHGSIDVNLVSIFQLALTNHTLRTQAINKLFDAGGDRLMFHQYLLYVLRVPHGITPFIDCGPVWTVQLYLVIPFRIMKRIADWLLALHLVKTDSLILIRKEFRGQSPDFLRIISGSLNIQLIDEFHQTGTLTYLSSVCGHIFHIVLPGKFIKIPNKPVVIPVGYSETFKETQTGDIFTCCQGIKNFKT